MKSKFTLFSSPSFYFRPGLFLLTLALCGLLISRIDSPAWLLFKSLAVFAAAFIAGGIFGYFKTLPLKLALSKISLGLFKLIKGILISFVVVCCAVAALLFWLADPFNLSAPADQKLMMTFHDHREAFEKLLKMATEDFGRATYIAQFAIDGNITNARKQEYQTLLSEIHPYFLYPGLQVAADYDGSVRFIFAGGRLSAISGGWLSVRPGSS